LFGRFFEPILRLWKSLVSHRRHFHISSQAGRYHWQEFRCKPLAKMAIMLKKPSAMMVLLSFDEILLNGAGVDSFV